MTDALTETPKRYLAAAEDGHLGRMIEGDERLGFEAFFSGRSGAFAAGAVKRQNGWVLAHRLCYGQGVRAGIRADAGEVPEVDNPYPQFSPAWEAWADGFEDEMAGALG